MLKTRRALTVLLTSAVIAILAGAIPAYGSVITNSSFSVNTGQSGQFATLSNNTSSLPSTSTAINTSTDTASVSVHGAWKSTDTNVPASIHGFVSMVLNHGSSAVSYVKVESLSGSANLSYLQVTLNGSSNSGQAEFTLINGTRAENSAPVSFSASSPLNFSIAFRPGNVTNKLIQYYTAYVTLAVYTSDASASGGVFIQDTINIAITEQVYGI